MTAYQTAFDWATANPETLADSPHVTQVITDPTRGHIVLHGAATAAYPASDIVFCDLGGGQLHLWTHSGCMLSPAIARDFGTALLWWADR